jgi:hypothetical protein
VGVIAVLEMLKTGCINLHIASNFPSLPYLLKIFVLIPLLDFKLLTSLLIAFYIIVPSCLMTSLCCVRSPWPPGHVTALWRGVTVSTAVRETTHSVTSALCGIRGVHDKNQPDKFFQLFN